MFVIVCYDISSDKLRNKIVSVLKRYGFRVQKSVFECDIENKRKYIEMKTELEKFLKYFNKNDKDDNLDEIENTETIRLYILSDKDKHKIEILGNGADIVENKPYLIL